MTCPMELGENAHLIVFADADLDAAAEGAIICKFRNNGQTCICANKIYVQASIYNVFAQKLADSVKKVKVGDGLDAETVLGPLINQKAILQVQENIADTTAKGAKILLGGDVSQSAENFINPTIVTGATKEMAVSKEKTFGPFAPLFKFKNVGEVIILANDTIFRLASYFYANELSRVHKVSEALEYGIVGVNMASYSPKLHHLAASSNLVLAVKEVVTVSKTPSK